MIDQVFEAALKKMKSPGSVEAERLTGRITIPVTDAYKEKYEELQNKSDQEFIDALRSVVTNAIDIAAEKML